MRLTRSRRLTRSTHPAIAALSPVELAASGCCAGVDEAREWSGLSCNTLYDLMDAGVLPWRWANKKTRLIPKRALAILLADYFAGPEDAPRTRPGLILSNGTHHEE